MKERVVGPQIGKFYYWPSPKIDAWIGGERYHPKAPFTALGTLVISYIGHLVLAIFARLYDLFDAMSNYVIDLFETRFGYLNLLANFLVSAMLKMSDAL
ncbi:hypothetical protein ACH5RR_000545 [Cinchona calisaya]|uniref:Uncharacterized protein n=1 Tax=Cinchona calisaya TaxID=153742 RepID=A0ABD3B0Z6_9GENT